MTDLMRHSVTLKGKENNENYFMDLLDIMVMFIRHFFILNSPLTVPPHRLPAEYLPDSQVRTPGSTMAHFPPDCMTAPIPSIPSEPCLSTPLIILIKWSLPTSTLAAALWNAKGVLLRPKKMSAQHA